MKTQNRNDFVALPFVERVYRVVQAIPPGQVATYGQVALLIGQPNAARAVGNALHRNPDSSLTPCHRVVNSQGRLANNFAFDGPMEQKVRLEAEGVTVHNNTVDLAKFGIKIDQL